jgi:hypothetical protein
MQSMRPANSRWSRTHQAPPSDAVGAPRRRTSRLLFAVAAASLIAVAGCGTASSAGSGSTGKSAHAELTVRLVTSGSTLKHWTLRCDPTGGNAPDAAATCKALMRMEQPFSPPKKHMMCPMILISSKRIVVTGTWFGHKVYRVVIDGECDLSLFNNLSKGSGPAGQKVVN